MIEFFCLILWVVCIGLMYWSDLDSQKHIEKGLNSHD
jgi:hypothetical protein